MCLSTVYVLKDNGDKELLCKNIASVTTDHEKIFLTNLMGVTTTVTGSLATVNLTDNYIYVRTGE